MDTAPSATTEDDIPPNNDIFMESMDAPYKYYRYVPRKEWRAAKPAKTRWLDMYYPLTNVIVNFHWGEEKFTDQEACQEYLRDEQRRLIRHCGEDDIPFHFLISDDGTVYEGRGWHAAGKKDLHFWRFEHLGYDRLDISYIGNYEDADDDERFDLIKPVMNLVDHGVVLGYVAQDWGLDKWPVMKDEINEWPPKNKGPPPPDLWKGL